MSERRYSALREAMRLVRSGDLSAATAAIQRQLGGAVASDPPAGARWPDPGPIEGTFRVVDEPPRAADTAPAEESPQPAATPEARTRFDERTYAGPAGTRRYKLFVPNAYRGQPLPLVVMLHGCKQTPDDFATGTRMNVLAEEHGCFVAYPAQAKSANGSNCWNWFQAGDQRRDRGEPAIIVGLVRELQSTYGVDPERVYVGGLSAGGAMAVIVARAYPDVFAAAGVHSGLPYAAAHDLPSAFAAMRDASRAGAAGAAGEARGAVPTIVFHGDRDATVHPANGQRIADEAAVSSVESATAGAPDGHAYTRRIFRDGAGKVVAEHWVVHGAAHAWSGGDPRGSYTDSRGPDASREMLRFFLERKLA